MSLKPLAFVHNLVLAAGSALLLIALASEVIPSLKNDGLFQSICGTNIFNGRLEALYYINYLFKVWELFDTILLVLKGSPLTFLHVYHHCLTFVLCYTQFVGQSSVVRTLPALFPSLPTHTRLASELFVSFCPLLFC